MLKLMPDLDFFEHVHLRYNLTSDSSYSPALLMSLKLSQKRLEVCFLVLSYVHKDLSINKINSRLRSCVWTVGI